MIIDQQTKESIIKDVKTLSLFHLTTRETLQTECDEYSFYSYSKCVLIFPNSFPHLISLSHGNVSMEVIK